MNDNIVHDFDPNDIPIECYGGVRGYIHWLQWRADEDYEVQKRKFSFYELKIQEEASCGNYI